ncbi:MAG: class I SAM-dependent methyltransferase [Candidatus Paceibacterota bacterium]
MNWYKRTILPRLLNSAMGRAEFAKIRPQVIGQAFGVVLEIGVGAGHNLPLYRNVSKVFALEPSEELLVIAKRQDQSIPVEFLNTGAEQIPLADSSVDTVVSTWTLCSVGNPQAVLKEIKRVLRPGGKFLFVDHGVSPNFLVRIIQNIVTPITKNFTGNCHLNRDIEELVKNAGFDVQKIEHPHERFKPLVYNYQGIAS